MIFLGIDWGKLVNAHFWLDVSPGDLSPLFEKYFLGITLIAWAIYGLSWFIGKRLIARRNYIKAKFAQKVSSFCVTMAVSFSFIFFFRYEAIPFLGGRFWVLIWALSGFIWFVYLVKYYFVNLPQQLSSLEEKQKRDKYLVGIKKKK